MRSLGSQQRSSSQWQAFYLKRPRRHICKPIEAVSTQGQRRVIYAVRQATSPAELRAAGYLRAYCFHLYPADRSEYAARVHRRMRGDAEWESVTKKVNGLEPDYKQMKVVALMAAIQDDPDCPVVAQAGHEMDLSTKLPADPVTGTPSQIVIGSLDINQGAVLPAEELVGRLPAEGQVMRRAYLSNVCVATAARRQGVAATLLKKAEQVALDLGVEHMYVHVIHDNIAAQQLYSGLGYEQETQETETFARALRRPRRLLLHKQLP